MRTPLKSIAKAALIRPLSILFILFIGAIGVQTIISCSSGDDPDDSGGDNGNGGGSSSSGGNFVYGSPVNYGGETYQTIVIGTQTWMARNLNYYAEGSVCNENSDINCQKYGRLYNWETANMVCPNGWHIPGNAEWSALLKFIDEQNQGNGEYTSCATSTCYDSYTAGKYLKAAGVWKDVYGQSDNSTNKYGFAALPGGYGTDGSFYGNTIGKWWTANNQSDISAYSLGMGQGMDGIILGSTDPKHYLLSVRCVKNNGDDSGGGSSAEDGSSSFAKPSSSSIVLSSSSVAASSSSGIISSSSVVVSSSSSNTTNMCEISSGDDNCGFCNLTPNSGGMVVCVGPVSLSYCSTGLLFTSKEDCLRYQR